MNKNQECKKRFKNEIEYLGESKTVNSINPLVSVTVTTFQHREYIEKCLNGILAQKTNFKYEIIIGEDESNDGTQDICKKYAEKYQDKIRLFLRSQTKSHIYDKKSNTSIRFNGIWCRMSSRGKYIAWCEGDDYWDDANKLQKQIDFLEKNLDYSICFHNVKVFDQKKRKFINDIITRDVLETTYINDLAKGNYIHTPSVVFRNNFIHPNWFFETTYGDWSLYMLLIGNKKIKKMSEQMAVYRIHNKGMIASKKYSDHINANIHNYQIIHNNLELNKKTKYNLKLSILKLKKIKFKNKYYFLWIFIRPVYYLYINYFIKK